MENIVHIIGAGLAGSEAAWQLAQRGIKVIIHEMRPQKSTPAHQTPYCAELVCSNSFRSDDYQHNAVGLLHEEMRRLGSLIMLCADTCKVPAGGALAVDRHGFASQVTDHLHNHPLISFVNEEVISLPQQGQWIIASGPLTSGPLIEAILAEIGNQSLNFYDAIAPVIFKESIDFSQAWYQSRYDKGDRFDYINCPLNKQQYEDFVDALLSAEKVEFHEFEQDAAYFDGCLPVEVMAERGRDTLLWGPMKPVGLTNPNHPGEKPYAVVQLRQDNKEDTLRNMVGFQTKMKYGEQQRVFRMIPGLENAEFARLGGIHRNTFIKSPWLLDDYLRLKSRPNLSFAGQITGCEGYIESAAIGWLAGYFAATLQTGNKPILPPTETAIGATYAHLRDTTDIDNYQPMNVNFGIFPTIQGETTANGKFRKIKGMERKEAYCRRALEKLEIWKTEL